MTTTDHILQRIGAELGRAHAPTSYRAPAIGDLVTCIDKALAARRRATASR